WRLFALSEHAFKLGGRPKNGAIPSQKLSWGEAVLLAASFLDRVGGRERRRTADDRKRQLVKKPKDEPSEIGVSRTCRIPHFARRRDRHLDLLVVLTREKGGALLTFGDDRKRSDRRQLLLGLAGFLRHHRQLVIVSDEQGSTVEAGENLIPIE